MRLARVPRKILVADDDLMLADCLVEALEDDGHEVCGVAATVAQAVALARLHQPDVAILDLHLRGGDRGTDIAEQLERSGDLGHTAVLYISGEAPRIYQEAPVGHACLSKPYTLDTLAMALEIVEDIAVNGGTSRPLPKGLQLLQRPVEALR